MLKYLILVILLGFTQLQCLAEASTWQADLTKANALMKAKDGFKAAPCLKSALTKAGMAAKLSRQELYALETSTAYLTAMRFQKFKEKNAGKSKQEIAAPYKEMVSKVLVENKMLLGLYEKHFGKDDKVTVQMRTSVQKLEQTVASM